MTNNINTDGDGVVFQTVPSCAFAQKPVLSTVSYIEEKTGYLLNATSSDIDGGCRSGRVSKTR
jgi:hypothetical protein